MEILNKENFADKVKEGTVLVDFSAKWCAACKRLDPILEDLSQSKPIFKIDCDESPELAKEFSIKSIPCTIFFKDGQVMEKTVGLSTKEKILATFDKLG